MRHIAVRRSPGLTFQEAVSVARKRITDGLYLIHRHGGWFRPEARGYTRNLSEAGLFSAVQARNYIDVDDLSVIRASEIVRGLDEEIADLHVKIAAAQRTRAILVGDAS